MTNCPECDEVVETHVIDQSGIASLEQICMHPDKRIAPDANGIRPICIGSDRVRTVYRWPTSGE